MILNSLIGWLPHVIYTSVPGETFPVPFRSVFPRKCEKNMAYTCCFCSRFVVGTFKKLLSHIKFSHSHEPNFLITCADCGRSFKKFNSFKSHIQRKHTKKDELEDVNGNDADSPEDEVDTSSDIPDDDPKQYINEMTRSLALFILKTKEEQQLTQQSINAIIENTEDLVDSSLQNLKDNITTCLERNGVQIAEIDGLGDVLQQPSTFSLAKQGLANEYQQLQYFKETFKLVVRYSYSIIALFALGLSRAS